jgi:hypothetical protein
MSKDKTKKTAPPERRSLPPDKVDPRAKNSGHGKKTADKWNQ